MTHTTTRVFAVALALGVLAGAGRTAAAQEPDPERAPVRLGPVHLWPALVLRNVGIDDNVFNEPDDPKRDFTFTAAPTVDAVIRPPRTRLSCSAGSDFVYFRDHPDERHINRSFGGRVEFDLTYFQPFASVGAAVWRERPNTEIDVRARNRSRTYTGGVRLPLGPIVSATVGVRRQASRYDPNVLFRGVELASELNNERNAIDGTLAVDVTPLTTIGLAVSKEEDRFDHSPLRNADSLRVAPTIAFKPYGPFSGSASVGWRRFDAVDPSIPDSAGLVAAGTVGVVIVDRYHVETTFGRDLRFSYEPETPTYVWTSGRGRLRMDLFGGVDVRILGGRDVLEYRRRLDDDAAARRDTLFVYGGGVGYNLGERLRMGVDAEFWRRKSAVAAHGYENGRVFASLAWGVRQQ